MQLIFSVPGLKKNNFLLRTSSSVLWICTRKFKQCVDKCDLIVFYLRFFRSLFLRFTTIRHRRGVIHNARRFRSLDRSLQPSSTVISFVTLIASAVRPYEQIRAYLQARAERNWTLHIENGTRSRSERIRDGWTLDCWIYRSFVGPRVRVRPCARNLESKLDALDETRLKIN